MALTVATMLARTRKHSLGICAGRYHASRTARRSLIFWWVSGPDAVVAAARTAARVGAEDSLGEVRGRIDHLAIDLARERLFIAELGNDSLGVVDLAAGKLLRRVGGLDEPQGVAYDPATDTSSSPMAVMDRSIASRVPTSRRSTLSGLAPTRTTSASSPKAGRVVVGYGDGALALMRPHPASRRPRSACPAIPSPFSSSTAGRGFSSTCRTHIRSQWWIGHGPASCELGLADAQANFPMALDEADARLVIVYRSPPATCRVRYAVRYAGGTPVSLR